MAEAAPQNTPAGDAGDAAVAANLADAATAQGLQTQNVRDGSQLTANVSEPAAHHVEEPKALGLKEGDEMLLREERGSFIVEPAPVVPKKIDLTGIYGSCPGIKPVERLDMAPRELDWEGKLLRR